MINKLVARPHFIRTSTHDEDNDFSIFLQMGQQLLDKSRRKPFEQVDKQESPLLQATLNILVDQEILQYQSFLYPNLLRFGSHGIVLSDVSIKRKQLIRNQKKCHIIILGNELILFFSSIEKQKLWYFYLKQYCIQSNLLMKYRLQEQIFENYFSISKKKNREMYSAIIIAKQQPYLRSTFAQLHRLKHQMILKIKGIFEDNSNYVMITDYFDAEPIYSYLVNGVKLNEIQLATLIYQILLLLKYLQSQNTYHGNINPQNILINKESQNLEMVLIGFCTHSFREGENTDRYLKFIRKVFQSDSLKKGEYPSIQTDLYQIGVTLYILSFFKNSAYDKITNNSIDFTLIKSMQEQLQDLKQVEYNHIFSSSQLDLMSKLLNGCQLQEAINHSWFINAKQKARTKKNQLGLPSLKTILEIRENEMDLHRQRFQKQMTYVRPSIDSENDSIDENPKLQQLMEDLDNLEIAPSKSHNQY